MWKGIVFTGIWIIPIVFLAAIVIIQVFQMRGSNVTQILIIATLVSIGTVAYIFNANDIRKRNGLRDDKITMLGAFTKQTSEYDFDDNRRAHVYPPINEALLFTKPTGYVFGRPVDDPNHYVCCDMSKEGQRIGIFAGSGCGKTQQSLMFIAGTKNKIHSLIIDPKKEITRLVYREGDNAKIFDPETRVNDGVHVGYDPFGRLNKTKQATEQMIFETMDEVASSQIALEGDSNDFWKIGAREMWTCCLMYFYQTGITNLPDIATYTLSKPIRELVEEIYKNSNEHSITRRIASRYVGTADETLTSISLNLVQEITKYSVDQRLVWALKYAPEKFTPETLLESSVYVSISLPSMGGFSSLVKMMVNQFATWTLGLPDHVEEPERANIALVFEEFTGFLAEVGKIDKIPQLLRYARSKNISIIIICQSISAIKAVYRNDNEVADMLSNLGYILIMQAVDKETQEWLCSLCGTFKKRTVSFNEVGMNGNTNKTISYMDEPIVTPQQLISLGGTDEAILISHKSSYSRIKKTPAWKQPGIKELLNS